MLTKADGVSRGGAALGVKRYVVNRSSSWASEKSSMHWSFSSESSSFSDWEIGDVLSLIEQAEKKVDKAKAEKFAQKLRRYAVWKISRINLIRWLIWVE